MGGIPLDALAEDRRSCLIHSIEALAGRYFLLVEHGVPVQRPKHGGISLGHATARMPALLRRMRRHDSAGRLPADDDAALAYIRQWLVAWPETESGRRWHWQK